MRNFFTTTLPKYGNMLLFGGSSAFIVNSLRDNDLKNKYIKSQEENKFFRDKLNNMPEAQKEAVVTDLNNSGGSTEIDNSIDTIERVSTELKRLADNNFEKAEEYINTIINENNKINSILEKSLELIKGSKNGNNYLDLRGDLTNILDNIKTILSELDHDQVGAVVHISGCIVIFYCLITIFSTLLGDRVISYFNLEGRYPRLAKFIKLRQHILNINLIFNIFIILLVLITIIYINFLVLFS